MGSDVVTAIAKPIRTQMLKIVFWQLTMIIGLALAVLILQGIHKGLSIVLGGLTYWLPTLIFVWRVTAYAGAREAIRFIVAFSVGEAVKLFLSGVFFVLIIKYFQVDLLYSIVGLMFAIISFWIASVISLYQQGVKR